MQLVPFVLPLVRRNIFQCYELPEIKFYRSTSRSANSLYHLLWLKKNNDSDASTSQFALLMDAIKNVEASVDSKLSNIKRELTKERESADDRLVKKLRLDGKTTFKKKSHEKQYFFNEQVRDKLVDSITSALEQTPPAVEKAKALLKEGNKLIDVHQKHIKIADRSEFGWATVAEYEEDELADNSYNEKGLFTAEGSARRKQKRKNVKDTTRKEGVTSKRYPTFKPNWL